MPKGQKKPIIHRRAGETARRAGVPTSPEGETLCPQGRKNETSPPHRQNRTPRRRPNFAGGRNSVPAGQKKRNIPAA